MPRPLNSTQNTSRRIRSMSSDKQFGLELHGIASVLGVDIDFLADFIPQLLPAIEEGARLPSKDKIPEGSALGSLLSVISFIGNKKKMQKSGIRKAKVMIKANSIRRWLTNDKSFNFKDGMRLIALNDIDLLDELKRFDQGSISENELAHISELNEDDLSTDVLLNKITSVTNRAVKDSSELIVNVVDTFTN